MTVSHSSHTSVTFPLSFSTVPFIGFPKVAFPSPRSTHKDNLKRLNPLHWRNPVVRPLKMKCRQFVCSDKYWF